MKELNDEPGTALETATPKSLLQVIAQAVANPLVDIEKMRALFELQKDILAEQHRIEFAGALTRLQAKLPQVGKYGKGKNSKFAKLEDIDSEIRRPMGEEGFNLTFNEESHTDKDTTFVMTLGPRSGTQRDAKADRADRRCIEKLSRRRHPARHPGHGIDCLLRPPLPAQDAPEHHRAR